VSENTQRVQPYDLAFAGTPFESEHFPLIEEDAETRQVHGAGPAEFLMAAPVGAVLRDILEGEEGTAAEQFGPLLYQAYHFWRFGHQVFALDESTVRALLDDTEPIGEWQLTPPAPAGYIQLPRNLVWSRIEEDARPEPVDGFFWTMLGENDAEKPPYARIDLLLVLGLLPGRPGFSVIPANADLPTEHGHFGDLDAREGGVDFRNVLPGGELQNLYALVNTAEVLKLMSRVFRRLTQDHG